MPARRCGSTRTAVCPARADADGVRHPGAESSASCRAWPPARTCGHRAGPSRMPVPTWRRSRSKAMRDGDHYVINGQKTWSTRATVRRLAVRPVSQRPGLLASSRPVVHDGAAEYAGHDHSADQGSSTARTAFAEVFFDDVRVPVDNRIGGEGQGWHVAMATAGFERGLLLRSPARFQYTARKLVELYQANREQRRPRPGLARGGAATPGWAPRPMPCRPTTPSAA